MKNHNIAWYKTVFSGAALTALSLVFISGVAVAQSNGISSTADRLSATANGSRASASGLNKNESVSDSAASNANGADATARGNTSEYDAGSVQNSGGDLTSGPCGTAYRKNRKRGQNPGSRLGCESKP